MSNLYPIIVLIAAATTITVNDAVASAETNVNGDAIIRAPLGDSEIVITTTSRVAGAIHSLTWNGKEFINSADHGRQMQSAINLDAGSEMIGETFNPTEAGSRLNGAGDKSTSRLLHLIARDSQLQTTTQMAFWLAPGEKSNGHLAKNKTKLSNYLLTKRVTIGYKDMPNVIQYDVTFSIPVGEDHNFAQFEAVTGYMPDEFKVFQAFNRDSGKLELLSDGPGEQSMPVVLATDSGDYAMGVYSPQQPSSGYGHAGYGRFRFTEQRVTKWNCVFRLRDSAGVRPGDYSFRNFVVVGDLSMVAKSLKELTQEFKKE